MTDGITLLFSPVAHRGKPVWRLLQSAGESILPNPTLYAKADAF
jgi:hypothetical protein